MFSHNTLSYTPDPELDAARYAARAREEDDLERAAESALKDETLELARAGRFDRLLECMDHGDNDVVVMRALVSCADAGSPEAKAAIDLLAQTYARIYSSEAF